MENADEYINEIGAISKQIMKRYRFLSKEISRCDKAICDIQHKIELTTFNSVQGYFLAKRLKDYLTERREIKDYFEQLQILASSFRIEKINDVKKKIEMKRKKQSSRIYSARVLDYDSLVEKS